MDFSKWEANIRPSVWGKGMATTQKSECPADDGNLPKGARYKGDCQDCEHFMGCRFEEAPSWGDEVPGCCWLKIERATQAAKQGDK